VLLGSLHTGLGWLVPVMASLLGPAEHPQLPSYEHFLPLTHCPTTLVLRRGKNKPKGKEPPPRPW